jgi:hypothetical protein
MQLDLSRLSVRFSFLDGLPYEAPELKRGAKYGAGDETRTRDIFLGKEVLYQLSYARNSEN